MQKQKTLAASFSLKGKGLHTGLDIEITFNPACLLYTSPSPRDS